MININKEINKEMNKQMNLQIKSDIRKDVKAAFIDFHKSKPKKMQRVIESDVYHNIEN